jgi:hypothetical protein
MKVLLLLHKNLPTSLISYTHRGISIAGGFCPMMMTEKELNLTLYFTRLIKGMGPGRVEVTHSIRLLALR